MYNAHNFNLNNINCAVDFIQIIRQGDETEAHPDVIMNVAWR